MSAEKPPPPPLPLQRPPGYRDPNISIHHPPPQKAMKLPPSFQQAKRRRACCRICCCCFCIGIVILIFVSAAAALTFYIWFQPRLPEIHLKSIEFTKFNVSTGPDAPVLDAATTMVVEIKNPNQNLGIAYDSTHILLSAVNGDANLGEDTVAGFSQSKDNVTTLKVDMRVEREILDGRSAEELKRGIKSKSLLLSAEISSGIGLKQRRWGTSLLPVGVVCDGVRLSQVEVGVGSMPKCRIKMFNWVFIS